MRLQLLTVIGVLFEEPGEEAEELLAFYLTQTSFGGVCGSRITCIYVFLLHVFFYSALDDAIILTPRIVLKDPIFFIMGCLIPHAGSVDEMLYLFKS